ncbi:hypothetical protein AMJ40_06395 [candidate division TA06 bacterium DG_26]|uniref:Bacterial Pleckstrin homology domain-containing protein n=1 Tax=candidate division TA06 bacterium DG_26 TaxID=1703771 RepID=A0A0S7WGJ8_UNCT6|nr:MAG: hypothetical protein AMJ40_06395 [candidate division TA06 bacterium DG_26]
MMLPARSLVPGGGTSASVMVTYKTASLDKTAIILTLVLAGAPVAASLVALSAGGEVRSVALVIAAILFVVCFATYALAPSSYAVSQDRIIVRRHLWPSSSIPMSQVKSCYPYPQLSRAKTFRLIGNGGAFGWYGIYACDELGTFRMYATNRSKAIVIGDGAKFILSPEKTESFVAAVHEYAQTRS